MTRKYKFTIATNRIGSEVSDEVELEFDDDSTEAEIEKQVNEIYVEWLCENNQGYFVAVE
jgi:hypothetical protein